MSGRLQGKVALVTGAARGIGSATALMYARQGAAMVVNYSKSREPARQLVDEIRTAGGDDIAYSALFLASDEASFITGQVLTVDGGRMDFLSHSG